MYPETPVTYYAIFEADPSIKFNYTVEHSNASGDIMFASNTLEGAYSVEQPLLEEKKTVRGIPGAGRIPAPSRQNIISAAHLFP